MVWVGFLSGDIGDDFLELLELLRMIFLELVEDC
jgi:hypothetical protein